MVMEAPPLAVYSSLDELLTGANAFANAQGYKLVVVRSKTNAAGQKTWVHLACDRHGTKRNTHNLTPETRKKNRKSRRCECPMYCVASRSQNADLWELSTRHAEHNHEPYGPPPPKKKDLPKPHASEIVNLPALQTPSTCTADFCMVPIGTGSPSVANEVAEVQRLLKRTNLQHSMHSAGTTIEGTWDEVTRFIGQAHSLLHGNGVIRIQTDVRISSRTDKRQSFQDKVSAVRALLDGIEREEQANHDSPDAAGDEGEETSLHDVDHSMADNVDPNIQPGLDQHRIMPTPQMHSPMQANMGHGMHQFQSSHQMHQGQHHHPHPLSQSIHMARDM